MGKGMFVFIILIAKYTIYYILAIIVVVEIIVGHRHILPFIITARASKLIKMAIPPSDNVIVSKIDVNISITLSSVQVPLDPSKFVYPEFRFRSLWN